ncbi:tRNA-splicing ligase RtcB [uncultured archaeon]|nr:tRNA-splicing ligase RtcB [uncultured archaeon]
MNLEKTGEVRFEIKKDESKGMRTDVVVYTNERMLEKIKTDRTLQQAVNATTLPGIVGKLLLMPDAHEGYGFPVGGVAAFDANNGIISPGLVGFDINCLVRDTKVYDENGTWRHISEFKGGETVATFDSARNRTINTRVLLSMSKMNDKKVLRIRTRLGKEINTTEDHPILTERGMVNAGLLKQGNTVVINGFDGLKYTRPLRAKIVSRDLLLEAIDSLGIGDAGNAKTQILNFLGKRGLEEVCSDDKKLPVLIKVLGFILGDGTIPRVERRFYTTLYGKEEDLLEIKRDLETLGIGSNIRHRSRHHTITTAYGKGEFDHEEYSLGVGSTAFCILLIALGAPFGNRSAKAYRVPEWIINSEDWQKRLFLAAYFGAELTKPLTHNGYNFGCPTFSINKLESLKDNAVAFLLDIKTMLASLGVETANPALVEGYHYTGVKSTTIGFRLAIESNTDNLIKFFGTVGYVYNKEKVRLSSLAALYLASVKIIREKRNDIRQKAVTMYAQGVNHKAIIAQLENDVASSGFIEHSIWCNRGKARVWAAQRFNEFIEKSEVNGSGFVYDEIESISEENYSDDVFDITVDDINHNFIANGIVVSNCGVRLIKTNLTEKDARPKLGTLLDALFKNIPSGVGSRLKIGLAEKDIERAAEEGVGYVLEKGYGVPEDMERVEENGMMKGADFSTVSKDARARGRDELGTLGAGNHFLEVQKVDDIIDEKTAKAYGLFKGQIVVMVHCGSRGFGHQICSDYLRSLVEYQKKKGIQLIDRELSYARIGDAEADSYLSSMKCAVNYAFANRQMITHAIRKSFEEVFGRKSDELGMDVLYDVAHNIAKLEEHVVEGKRVNVYVHRKGATRAFPKGRREVPREYRSIGQPVLIPGSMGTASYVLCGLEGSMAETFGTTCHGSGRVMSRTQALNDIPADRTFESLKSKGIEIRVRSRKLISEEAEWAYKNVDDVVGVVEKAGISSIVSRDVPIGVIKG